MFKIQVRVSKKSGHLPPELLPFQKWQDLKEMPDFDIWEAAEDWLTDNKAHVLEKFGLEFQIIKK